MTKLSEKQQEVMEMFTTLFYTPSTNEAAEATWYDYVSSYAPSTVKSLVNRGLIITNMKGSAYWLTDEGKAWAMEYMVAKGYYTPVVEVEAEPVAEVVATVAEPLNLDEKHFMRILQMTDDTAKIEASLAKCNERGYSKDYSGEVVKADHVVVTVVEDEGKSYRWFWNGRGWIEYLNEAKLYTCEEAKRGAKILATRTNGHPIISPIQNEIDLAQRQAHGVIADEHRYVTKSKQLRQVLTDALDTKGIGYAIPENTSAVIVGVAGRGSVGVSQYGEVRYTVWGHGYGNGECKNVGTIDEVVNLFN